MSQLHKELELLVGKTDWENEYREVHTAVENFPLEETISLAEKSPDGLGSDELGIVKKSFLEYEKVVNDYKTSKIKLKQASKRNIEIEEKMNSLKENLTELTKKIYKEYEWAQGERKPKLAQTYVTFYEIAKKHKKLPRFSGAKLTQAQKTIDEHRRKELEKTEKEKALVNQEINKLNKILKDSDYEEMRRVKYTPFSEENKKEYEQLFDRVKKTHLEYERITQEKREEMGKNAEQKENLEKIMEHIKKTLNTKENLGAEEILDIKNKIAEIKQKYSPETIKRELYHIKAEVIARHEIEKNKTYEFLMKMKGEIKNLDESSKIQALYKLSEYKIMKRHWDQLNEILEKT